jgi:hypothetical protein
MAAACAASRAECGSGRRRDARRTGLARPPRLPCARAPCATSARATEGEKPSAPVRCASSAAAAHCFQRLETLPLPVRPTEDAVALGERGELGDQPDHAPGTHGGRDARRLHAHLDHARLLQPADRRPPGTVPALPSQPRNRLRTVRAREPLQDLPLQRRAGVGRRCGVGLAQRDPVRRAVGERRGERAAQHLAEGCDVVVGDPAAEREQRRRNRRLGIEDAVQLADGPSPGTFAPLPDGLDPPDPLGPPERHQHARAGDGAPAQLRRDGVGERVEHRERERDLDEHERIGTGERGSGRPRAGCRRGAGAATIRAR